MSRFTCSTTFPSLLLVLILSGASGCGKLNEKKAGDLIVARLFQDSWATCTWREAVTQTSSGSEVAYAILGRTDASGPKLEACLASLKETGFIRSAVCIEPFVEQKSCFNWQVTPSALGPPEQHHFEIPCGGRKFVAVTSIRTEENKATVRYTRDLTPDDSMLQKLSACNIEPPQAGVIEREAELVRDDAGNWSVK